MKCPRPEAHAKKTAFIVAIEHGHNLGNFQWPHANELPAMPISDVLDPAANYTEQIVDGSLLHRKLQHVLKHLSDHKIAPHMSDVIIDMMDDDLGSFAHGVSPPISKVQSYVTEHFVVAKGRRFTPLEMERLFGMHDAELPGRQEVSASPPRISFALSGSGSLQTQPPYRCLRAWCSPL